MASAWCISITSVCNRPPVMHHRGHWQSAALRRGWARVQTGISAVQDTSHWTWGQQPSGHLTFELDHSKQASPNDPKLSIDFCFFFFFSLFLCVQYGTQIKYDFCPNAVKNLLSLQPSCPLLVTCCTLGFHTNKKQKNNGSVWFLCGMRVYKHVRTCKWNLNTQLLERLNRRKFHFQKMECCIW